jgi:general stress protein YciG
MDDMEVVKKKRFSFADMTPEQRAKVAAGRFSFAELTSEQRKAIAAKGGVAAKAENRSFTRSSELAREAGRKGGIARKGSVKAGASTGPEAE